MNSEIQPRGSTIRDQSFIPFLARLWNSLLYSVDLKVWSKPTKRAQIKCIASKCVHDFDCDCQHASASSHCVTLTRVLLWQIISYSDTKVTVLVVMEFKRASVLYVRELIFLLHTSRSTEYRLVTSNRSQLHFKQEKVNNHLI